MGMHTIFNLTQRLRVAGAVLMVSSLGLFCPGNVSNVHAQSPSKATPPSPAGGPKEGIKVHGHWTIDIRNPDGKLVSHHEFENALNGSGAFTLGQLLQRTSKAGEWRISLGDVGNSNPNHPCLTANNQQSPCNIYETGSQFPEANAFKSLTVSSTQADNNATGLTGTATAQRDGRIVTVQTQLSRCPVDTQGVCQPSSFEWFTTKSLSPVINVVAGQIIQVKVVISFS